MGDLVHLRHGGGSYIVDRRQTLVNDMTTITIDRALLEQALASMVRAELIYGQPNQAIQEALRAELAKLSPKTHTAIAQKEGGND